MLMRIAALFTPTHSPSERAVQQALCQSNATAGQNAPPYAASGPVEEAQRSLHGQQRPAIWAKGGVQTVETTVANGVTAEHDMAASPDSLQGIADSIIEAQSEVEGRGNKVQCETAETEVSPEKQRNTLVEGAEAARAREITDIETQLGNSPFANAAVVAGGGKSDSAAEVPGPLAGDETNEIADEAVRSDRFTLEIIRCRGVCPDWQDDASHATSSGRPDTLILGVPHLLLQLPVANPAPHPVRHAVEVGIHICLCALALSGHEHKTTSLLNTTPSNFQACNHLVIFCGQLSTLSKLRSCE